MISTQLHDDLSEMESRSKLKDIEIAKLKEDRKLMMKQLSERRSNQNQQQEILSQVQLPTSSISDVYAVVVSYNYGLNLSFTISYAYTYLECKLKV